ncbi:hypothetical protein WJX77_003935 [Trebouxia sp. C0004]
MSFVQPSTVHAIAQSLEVGAVSDEAAKALSPDVEYRLREVVQEAQKFMRHSKRRMLTTDDINQALRLKNVQPLYGFGGKDPARFARAAGQLDLLYVHDPELTFEQAVDQPLPKVPVEVGVIPHWLAIEGVQPAIPENAAIQPRKAKRPKLDMAAAAKAKTAVGAKIADASPSGRGGPMQSAEQAAAAAASAEGQEGSLVRAPVKHVLSQELQLYFDRVAQLLRAKPGTEASSGLGSGANGQEQSQNASQLQQQRAVLASLAVDPGLHPLTPYFSQLIAEEGRKSLKSLPTLHLLLKALGSLVGNEVVQLEPYLHQIMPFILTCMVGKRLGASGLEDHWSVREEAARLAALVCAKYGQPYYQIQPRITQALNTAFQQANNPLTTHYGAIVGLTALGHQAVRNALYPNLHPYLALLQEQMQQSGNEMKRYEAYKCFGALLHAAGAAIRERVKSMMLPASATKNESSPVTPEQEDDSAELINQDPPSSQQPSQGAQDTVKQGKASTSRADSTSEEMDIDVMGDAAPVVFTSAKPDDTQPLRSQADDSRAAQATKDNACDQAEGQSQRSSAKPSSIPCGLHLPKKSLVRRSDDFADPGSINAVLASAWSQDSDVGKQLAALYEMFGDAIMTYVPMLPYLSAPL